MSKVYFIANKQKISAVLKLALYFMLFLWNYSCSNIPVELGECMLYCNSSECRVLDEEKCECVLDMNCLIERFCKGPVCSCKESDGGKWCSYLTGDSIKTWDFAFVYDSLRKSINSHTNYDMEANWMGIRYTYRVGNRYYEGAYYPGYWNYYYWEFDDVYQPTKIIYTLIDSKAYAYILPDLNKELLPDPNKELEIVKLNEDSLIALYNDGLVEGVVVFVADNH